MTSEDAKTFPLDNCNPIALDFSNKIFSTYVFFKIVKFLGIILRYASAEDCLLPFHTLTSYLPTPFKLSL